MPGMFYFVMLMSTTSLWEPMRTLGPHVPMPEDTIIVQPSSVIMP